MHRGLPSGCCTELGSDGALGRVLTPLLLGLRRLLLRCCNHLKYGALSYGYYMHAYEINKCISMMYLIYFNWNALRTVRAQVADRPPYYSTDPPETTTSLEQFLDSTADCPRPSGGPSAVQSCELPPETSSLDRLQVSTADRPLPTGGPSAVLFYRPTRTKYLSGQTLI